ncbi:hypothetical protein ACFX5K_06135 [Rickettsiales bacterium LUAb2]
MSLEIMSILKNVGAFSGYDLLINTLFKEVLFQQTTKKNYNENKAKHQENISKLSETLRDKFSPMNCFTENLRQSAILLSIHKSSTVENTKGILLQKTNKPITYDSVETLSLLDYIKSPKNVICKIRDSLLYTITNLKHSKLKSSFNNKFIVKNLREVSDKLYWCGTRLISKDKSNTKYTILDAIPNPNVMQLRDLQSMYSKLSITANNYGNVQKKHDEFFKVSFDMPLSSRFYISKRLNEEMSFACRESIINKEISYDDMYEINNVSSISKKKHGPLVLYIIKSEKHDIELYFTKNTAIIYNNYFIYKAILDNIDNIETTKL